MTFQELKRLVSQGESETLEFKRKVAHPEKIVKDLIHGYPRKLSLHKGKLPQLIIPPKRETMWVRDSSAVTPAGVIINSMESKRRQGEPELVRAVFKHHPMFDPDSIFLDMVDFNRSLRDDVTFHDGSAFGADDVARWCRKLGRLGADAA